MDKGKKHPARKVVRHLLRRDPRLSLPARFFDLASCSAQSGEEFEITFFENILEKDPCNEDALMFLGHAYTRLGQYEKGLSFDERLVRLRPADPTAFYNLACSYSLLHRTSDAFNCLKKALALGYNDFSHMLKDPDLEHLRSTARFRGLIARFLNRDPANS